MKCIECAKWVAGLATLALVLAACGVDDGVESSAREPMESEVAETARGLTVGGWTEGGRRCDLGLSVWRQYPSTYSAAGAAAACEASAAGCRASWPFLTNVQSWRVSQASTDPAVAMLSCSLYSPKTVGPFTWSRWGKSTAMTNCVQVTEPWESNVWSDNFFCASSAIGLRWSYAGPIAGMRCTLINEPADPNGWNDNYLCVPTTSSYSFQWSYAGPIAGKTCLPWSEPGDPHGWNDNHLCW